MRQKRNSSDFLSSNIVTTLIFILVLVDLVHPSFIHNKKYAPSGPNHRLKLRKNDNCVDCVIIGAGPSGLVTSIAISKASPSSSIAIFEKDAFEPKGSTIAISRTGYKSLKQLHAPLEAKLKDVAYTLDFSKVRFNAPWTFNREEEEQKQLASKEQFIVKRVMKKLTKKIVKKLLSLVSGTLLVVRLILWHDVRMILKDEAERLYGENVHSIKGTALAHLNSNHILTNVLDKTGDNNNIENKEQKQRFELTFRNTHTGKTQKVFCKYLFACDGAKSAVRSILPKEPDILLSENKSVWRGTTPNIPSNSSTVWQCPANEDTNGRSVAVFPAARKGGLGTAWSVISDIEDGKAGSMEEARERVLKVIETMNSVDPHPDYDVLKQYIDDSSIIVENKLHVRDFDKPWESAYDGLIYIGDAAHPVRPTGEGIALALEDANVLCQLISKSGLSVTTLRKYEDERFLPVKTISEKVRELANDTYK